LFLLHQNIVVSDSGEINIFIEICCCSVIEKIAFQTWINYLIVSFYNRRWQLRLWPVWQSLRLQILQRQASEVHPLCWPRRPEIPLSPVQPLVRETGPSSYTYLARSWETQTSSVQSVWQAVFAVLEFKQASKGTQWWETIQMSLLHQGIHCIIYTKDSHPTAQRRETIQMSSLW